MNWLGVQMAGLDAASVVTRFSVTWLLQSSVLIAIGLSLASLMANRGAAVQSLVLRTTLVAAMLCPLATWCLSLAGVSGWSVDVPRAWSPEAVAARSLPDVGGSTPHASPQLAAPIDFPRSTDRLSHPIGIELRAPATMLEHSDVVMHDRSPAVASSRGGSAADSNGSDQLVDAAIVIHRFGALAIVTTAVWFGVSCTLLIRLATAWRTLGRLRRRALSADAQTIDECQRLASVLRVAAPDVLRSPYLPSPCLAGLRRPVVLLPDGDLRLSIREVLIHELAHLKRRDCHWNLLRQLATSLFFFQPLLWRLSRAMEWTAEEVCDDFVVDLGGDRCEYAHQLVDIVELSSVPFAAASVGIVSLRSMLARRVTRIMDASRPLSIRVGNLLLVAVVAGGLCGTALTGFMGLRSTPSTANAELVEEAPSDDEAAVERNRVSIEGVAEEERDRDADRDAGDIITMRGQVVDPQGRPFAGADVHVTRWYWDPVVPRVPLATVRSESDGRFEISYRKSQFTVDLQRSEMWNEIILVATAPDYGPGWVSRTDLTPNEQPTLQLVDDSLPIEGQVVDLEGNPLAGVQIKFTDGIIASKDGKLDPWLDAIRRGEILWQATNRHLGQIAPHIPTHATTEVITGPTGRFELKGIGKDRLLRISLQGPNAAFGEVSIITRKIDPIVAKDGMPHPDWSREHTVYGAHCQIVAQPTQPIHGIVRDAKTGQPLPGVAVESYRITARGISAQRQIRVQSDDAGRFVLVGMPKGTGNQIIAVPNDSQPYLMREFDVPDQPGLEPIQMELDLHRGIWIRGRVTSVETGEPLQNVRAYYLPYRANAFAQALPEFDDDGNVDGYQARYETDEAGTFRMVGLPGPAIIGIQAITTRFPLGMGHEKIAGLNEAGHFLTYNNPIQPGRLWPTAMKEVDVTQDAADVQVDFRLDPGHSFKLLPVDPRGGKVENLNVAGSESRESWQAITSDSIDVIALAPGETRSLLLHQAERRLGKALSIVANDQTPRRLTVQLEPCATVRGQLVDENDQPISGARIRLRPGPGGDFSPELNSIATDEMGRFEHDGVLPGAAYSVMSESVQFGFKALAEDLTVAANETIDLGTIDVTNDKRPEPMRSTFGVVSPPTDSVARDEDSQRVTEVVGTIVDADGRPLADADVAVIATRTRPVVGGDLSPTGEVVAEARTDATGRYRLTLAGVSSKSHRDASVIARQDGRAMAWKLIGLDEPSLNVPLAVGSEQPIKGKLVDIEGQPAAGVRLTVQSVVSRSDRSGQDRIWIQCERMPAAWLNSVTSDDQGRFEVRGVPTQCGVYLTVNATDRFAPQSLAVNTGMPAQRGERDRTYRALVRNADEGEEVVLPLAPPQIFEGVVTYADSGQPAPHARLTIWASQQESGSMRLVDGQADAEGRYRISPYPGVRFGITAYPPQGAPYLVRQTEYDKAIRWRAGDRVRQYDVTLPRGVSVHGKIVDAASGGPVEAVTVQYIPEQANNQNSTDDIVTGWQAIRLSDEQGVFEIPVLPGPGWLMVQALKGSYVLQELADRQLSSGKPGGRRTYAHAFHRVNPEGETSELHVTIPLQSSSVVTGEMVDPQGQPVDEAFIISRLATFPGSTTWRGQMPLTLGGRFSLSGLDAERDCSVHFLDAQRRLGATVNVKASASPLRVELHPCGEATARFVAPNGQPHVGFSPGLHLVVTPGAHEHDFAAAGRGELLADADFVSNIDRVNYWPGPETDSQGSITFPALIPGATYRIDNYEDGEPHVLNLFTVESGESRSLGEFVIDLDEN